jgi:chromosome segregation ATPase
MTHKKSTSSQVFSIEIIQSKLNQLQEKYSNFVSRYCSTLEKVANQDKNNKNNLDLSKEMKKYSNEAGAKDESCHFSQIVENFLSISKVIPPEYENEFSDFKAETLKYIYRLSNRIPKAFQSTSPEAVQSLKKKKDFSLPMSLKVKDSNRETEETSLVFHTGDLSRESSKNANKSQVFTNQKNVPRLKLNKIEEFSPIQTENSKKNANSVRLKKIKAFHSIRDSINPENQILENKLKQTLRYTKSFLKNVQNLCENDPQPLGKVEKIIGECFELYEKLEKIENQEVLVSAEEIKLKDELENCKKVALMLEQRLKIKNETILILRKKERDWSDKSEKLKHGLVVYFQEISSKEKRFFEVVSEKVMKIKLQFVEIEKKIKKNLELGLEEIKKAVEMTSKNDFFDSQGEVFQKTIDELEYNNRKLFEKCKIQESEILEIKSKCLELESANKALPKYQEDTQNMISELEHLSETVNSLKKSLKIKEFELKQKEFEKSELDADKNELLTNINSLEIQKIEYHECINNLTMKYNQEIENFIYNNTVQRNQLQVIEKEKEELIKQKFILENSLKEITTENALIKENLKKIEEQGKQNSLLLKKIQNIEEVVKTKDQKIKSLEKQVEELREKLSEKKLVEKNDDMDKKDNLIQTLQLKVSEMEAVEIVSQDQISSLKDKIKKLQVKNSSLKEEMSSIKICEPSELQEEIILLKEKISHFESLENDPEIKDSKVDHLQEKLNSLKRKYSNFKSIINSQTTQISDLKLENERLLQDLHNLSAEKEKTESISKFLIEDLKHRHQSYKDSIEDLKLDKYEYEKTLKIYESKLETISNSFNILEKKYNDLSPIPENFLKLLTDSQTQNEIGASTKEILLSKIIQLEEDVKSLTSKLLKKNNENSALEDCLMVCSPRSKNQPSEDLAKIKYELIETSKKLEESLNEKNSLQINLTNCTIQLEDSRKALEKTKENLINLENSFKIKCEEHEKIKKNSEDLQNENEKISKLLTEAKSSLKNSEVTYGKNLSFLEEQVKKYKKDSENSFDKSNLISSPRSFFKDFKISKENSLVISSVEKPEIDSPNLSRRVLEEDSFEESSFNMD